MPLSGRFWQHPSYTASQKKQSHQLHEEPGGENLAVRLILPYVLLLQFHTEACSSMQSLEELKKVKENHQLFQEQYKIWLINYFCLQESNQVWVMKKT